MTLRRNAQQAGRIWASDFLQSGSTIAAPACAVLSQQATITETTGAGVYTAAFVLPAGAVLIDIIVSGVAQWDTQTSATLKVGDSTDDDGYFTGVNLKATDLLTTEEISLSAAGGKQGADVANSQINRRYSATARTINAIVTTVGTTGSAGRTVVTVLYALANVTASAQGGAITSSFAATKV